jgi:predicted site-specific integrase-resolvase
MKHGLRFGLHILSAKLEAKMAIIGYARVSAQGQDLTAQLDALKAAGAATVYKERLAASVPIVLGAPS